MLPYLSNVNEIVSYAHWLIMRGQIAGNLCFDGHLASDEEREIAFRCKTLCASLEKKLQTCREADIADLLGCYGMLVRLGYNRIPDAAFVEKHRRRFFNAWRRGDRDIDESEIFGMIATDAKYHPKKIGNEGVNAYRSILEHWTTTLNKYGYFPDTTTYENYRRLAFIMRENIDSYLNGNSDEAKHNWYEQNKVEDFSTLGSYILCSFRRFANALYPDVLDYENQVELDNRILSELVTRTDLNHYERQTFLLTLRFNSQCARNSESIMHIN